jgi:hypothetical protein
MPPARAGGIFWDGVEWLDKVREDSDQDDDRDRNAKQPKDDALTHNCVSLC